MQRLIEISRVVYGHDRSAINRHSKRCYRSEPDGRLYILSRTLDGCPPFFEAYGPYRPEHTGTLPHLKVGGKAYWGDGWSWRRALRAFCREIGAEVCKQ